MSKSEQVKEERDRAKVRVQEMGNEIQRVRKPFEEAMRNATKTLYVELEKQQKLERNLTDLYEQTLRNEIADTWKGKAPTKDNFSEWANQSKEWDTMFKSSPPYNGNASQRKAGDITILALTEPWEKFYVAFKGAKVVGYMQVEPSQHPGDSTRVPVAVVKGVPLTMAKDKDSGWSYNSVLRPLEQFTKALEREFGK